MVIHRTDVANPGKSAKDYAMTWTFAKDLIAVLAGGQKAAATLESRKSETGIETEGVRVLQCPADALPYRWRIRRMAGSWAAVALQPDPDLANRPSSPLLR